LSDRAGVAEENRLFRVLLIAFAVQVAGRLLDFWWHASHDEFETGVDQIRAHWLVWSGTILVLLVTVRALRSTEIAARERLGYQMALVGNGVYVPIAIIHFIQHLNLEEVDWAHIGLAITNVVAFVGVLIVIAAYLGRRRGRVATP
jgi:hypothetical protein